MSTTWAIAGIAALLFLFWFYRAGKKAGRSKVIEETMLSQEESLRALQNMEIKEDEEYAKLVREHTAEGDDFRGASPVWKRLRWHRDN